METVDKNDKKEEILKASYYCFSQYGYEKTTMEDIGKIAGLNKTSLYYYYKNKELIYLETISKEADSFIAELNEKILKIDDCNSKIIFYLSERFRFFKEKSILFKLPMQSNSEILNVCNKMSSILNDKEINFFCKMIEGYTKNGILKQVPCEMMAQAFISFSNGLKIKNIKYSSVLNIPEIDYESLKRDVDFYVPLIMDGFLKK